MASPHNSISSSTKSKSTLLISSIKVPPEVDIMALAQDLLHPMESRDHGRKDVESSSHSTEDLLDSALGKSEQLLLEFGKLGISLDDADDDASTCVGTVTSSPLSSSPQSDLEDDDASETHQPKHGPSPASVLACVELSASKERVRILMDKVLEENSEVVSRFGEHVHVLACINSLSQKLENEVGVLRRERRAAACVIQSPQHLPLATPLQPRRMAPSRSKATPAVHSTRVACPALRAGRAAVPRAHALSPILAPFVGSASPRRL